MVESKNKGGRPRTFDRDVALEISMKLFWDRGYDGVSISDLTAAIGIEPPSLYKTFGSKADLYREALERYRAELAETYGVPPGTTALEAVKAALEISVLAVSRPDRPPGCMVSIGLLACGPAHDDLARHLRSLRRDTYEGLRERIAQGHAAGELPPGTDVPALARFYAAVLQGMAVQARDGATSQDLEHIVASALKAWPPLGG